jgi:hypothetical protein
VDRAHDRMASSWRERFNPGARPGRPSPDPDANRLPRSCQVDLGPLGGPDRVSCARD